MFLTYIYTNIISSFFIYNQVEAARRTALAAVAAQTGEIDTTAKAVMDAAKSLRQASSSDKNTAQSKTCVIL